MSKYFANVTPQVHVDAKATTKKSVLKLIQLNYVTKVVKLFILAKGIEGS